MRLQGYIDSDWAGNTVDRKSTFGCCFTLGSAMVSWCSRKQYFCGFEHRRSRGHCIKCGFASSLQIYLNMCWIPLLIIVITRVVKILENPVFHGKSKHIEIKYHYIRDMVQKKAILVQYLPIDEQVADVLTKPRRSSSTSVMDSASSRSYSSVTELS
jgi:hypothetical protein